MVKKAVFKRNKIEEIKEIKEIKEIEEIEEIEEKNGTFFLGRGTNLIRKKKAISIYHL